MTEYRSSHGRAIFSLCGQGDHHWQQSVFAPLWDYSDNRNISPVELAGISSNLLIAWRERRC